MKIKGVAQKNETADDYIVRFMEYETLTGFGDVTLVNQFKKGLNYNLLSKIYALPNMPTTLDEWKSWASKFDRQLRELRQNQEVALPPRRRFGTASYSTSTPLPRTTGSAPIKREPDTTTHIRPFQGQRRPLSQVECYRCGMHGHYASSCPNSSQGPSTTQSQTRRQQTPAAASPRRGRGTYRGGRNIRVMDERRETATTTKSPGENRKMDVKILKESGVESWSEERKAELASALKTQGFH